MNLKKILFLGYCFCSISTSVCSTDDLKSDEKGKNRQTLVLENSSDHHREGTADGHSGITNSERRNSSLGSFWSTFHESDHREGDDREYKADFNHQDREKEVEKEHYSDVAGHDQKGESEFNRSVNSKGKERQYHSSGQTDIIISTPVPTLAIPISIEAELKTEARLKYGEVTYIIALFSDRNLNTVQKYFQDERSSAGNDETTSECRNRLTNLLSHLTLQKGEGENDSRADNPIRTILTVNGNQYDIILPEEGINRPNIVIKNSQEESGQKSLKECLQVLAMLNLELGRETFDGLMSQDRVQRSDNGNTPRLTSEENDEQKYSMGFTEHIEGRRPNKAGMLSYLYHPNSPDDFDKVERSRQIDQYFFNPPDKKKLAATLIGTCCSVLGIACALDASGYILYNLGDFFNFDINGMSSIATQIIFVASTIPPCMTQFFNLAKDTSYGLLDFIERRFSSSLKSEMKPRTIERGAAYYGLQFANVISAALNATTPLILLKIAEEKVTDFFEATGTFFYISWAQNCLKLGSATLRSFLHTYDTEKVKSARRYLKDRIIQTKQAIQRDPDLVNAMHQQLTRGIRDNFSIGTLPTGQLEDIVYYNFLYTMFFRSYNHEGLREGYQNPHYIESETPRWSSFCSGTSFIATASTFAVRYYIIQVLLNKCFQDEDDTCYRFLNTGDDADIVSNILAGVETSAFLITSYIGQRLYMEGIKDFIHSLHTSKDNFWFFRKLGEVTSSIAGVGFALAPVVQGKDFISEAYKSLKYLTLTPLFVSGLSYYHQFFLSGWNGFFDNISRAVGFLNPLFDCEFTRRAELQNCAGDIYELIDTLDPITIEDLYENCIAEIESDSDFDSDREERSYSFHSCNNSDEDDSDADDLI